MTSLDGKPPGLNWDYTPSEIVVDGVVHAVGLCFGIVGAAVLIGWAAGRITPVELAAILIYAAGLIAMLSFSAAYNLTPVSRVKWILRRFDHSAIFLMIAGTYTPFLTQIKNGMAALAIGIVVWGVAAAGIALKVFIPGRFDRLSIAFYLLLSSCGLVAYDAVVASLPTPTLWLLLAGGLLYTFGVIFHVWESLRFQNAIWHGFVLSAAVCHYVAILDCIVLTRA